MNIIKRLLRKVIISKSLQINMIDTDRLIYLMKKEVQTSDKN